jgi:hypothetical protein
MLDESQFLTEFLSETNLVLAQIDYENKLYDLICPIRNYFMKQKGLLSFSVARYCGASTSVAFFCEWYFQTLKLTGDSRGLFDENRQYFGKKVPLKFRGIPNIFELVEKDIAVFVPQQLALLQSKSKSILDNMVKEFAFLERYLNDKFLSQVFASTYGAKKRKYTDTLSLSQYLDSQGSGSSFVQIGLPCLLGFCYNFNQKKATENVKWVLLEELLKNICTLHQINQNKQFDEFIYSLSLTEKEEFVWMQKNENDKQNLIANSKYTKDTVLANKSKLYNAASNTLKTIDLPDQNKDMLKELLEWSMQSANFGKV